MARSKNILRLDGFDGLIKEIEKAGGKIDNAVEKASKAGAAELESSLKAECAADGVPASVSGEIRVEYERSGNAHKTRAGWEMGAYNPDNLSAGFKALFLNYGTPNRTKHGKVKARGFITRAKKKSKKKIKAAQQGALDEILKGLKE